METDLLLINKIKDQNDNYSLKELIDRHSGIYMDIVNKIISDSCDFVNKTCLQKYDISLLAYIPKGICCVFENITNSIL